MSNNNITDLRDILFDTLRDMKAGKVKIEEAKAISEVAQVIINSAKVEVEHRRHTGLRTTAFLEDKQLQVPYVGESYSHKSGHNTSIIRGIKTEHHDDDLS